MKVQTKEILDLFFDPNETICVSDSKYAYHSVNQDVLNDEIELISSNEKVSNRFITEEDVVFLAINPINGFRNDKNVTALRSFMIELDYGSLAEQFAYIEESKLPFSTCVYSGNKSLHFGIALDEPCNHISTWRQINQWILNVLTKADQQNKNPSRCIRFPGNIRKDGKQEEQVLLCNHGRVPRERLNSWLQKHFDKAPKPKIKKLPKGELNINTSLPRWVKKHFKNGIEIERNVTWFNIACYYSQFENIRDEDDLAYVLDKYFEEHDDFSRNEWMTCLKSAFNRVRGQYV
jgi:hypothetical protein